MQSKLGQPYTYTGSKKNTRGLMGATVIVKKEACGRYRLTERASFPPRGSDIAPSRTVELMIGGSHYHALITPSIIKSPRLKPKHAVLFVPYKGYFELVQIPLTDVVIIDWAEDAIPYLDWGTVETSIEKIDSF